MYVEIKWHYKIHNLKDAFKAAFNAMQLLVAGLE